MVVGRSWNVLECDQSREKLNETDIGRPCCPMYLVVDAAVSLRVVESRCESIFRLRFEPVYFQVMRAAEILAVDLLEESFLVPVLKTLLPSLSNAYQSGCLEEDPCTVCEFGYAFQAWYVYEVYK